MQYFKFSSVLVFLIFISSCSSFINMNVTMLEPGGVYLNPGINTIALVNRAISVPKKENRIEAIVTMEGENEDKQGRQQILEGLNAALIQSPRLKSKITGIELKGDGTGTTFPAPISWDSVALLCNQNGVDALLALETYDSDCIITHTTGNVQVNNAFGIPIPTVQFNVTQKIIIKAGFRLYDPKTRIIVDQYTFSYWQTYTSQGSGLGEAIAALANRQLSVNQTSSDAGYYYEKHLSPSFMTERRHLYKKAGSSPLAIGSRMAIVGNWAEATDYFKQALQSGTNRKTCGRAAYNLALAAEIKGDLFEAKNWISKSYGEYNNSQAPYYQNTLNRRYNDMMKLNQQMQQQQADSLNKR